MVAQARSRAVDEFREHLNELAETWYDGDIPRAFRHAAFQTLAPDPTLSDEQVIELTAIDQSGDLEVDGWFVDEQSETVFLFQSAGGANRIPEGKVTKFWEAPEELLNAQRVRGSNNQLIKELSDELDARIADDYGITMVLASRGGFERAAISFAQPRRIRERALARLSGEELTCPCTLQLLDFAGIAKAFDDYRAGFRNANPIVELTLNSGWSYVVDQSSPKSIRATIPASEIVRIFNDVGYKLFNLNPRGPIANAKVNKNISKTLDSIQGRRNFHLLNNGMCATCDDFTIGLEQAVSVANFQIVNGCQTTVTLSKRTPEELAETHVDLKLVVADAGLAQNIAEASNSQTALRAKDYTSFERQQRLLSHEFESLQPPWFYEIKQGYWRFVLSDQDKAIFKTGRRKRHIEVQPLAQASLAFLDHPEVALDRVRYVFQGIRSAEDRHWYERAFPLNVRAQQLILPWTMLQEILRRTPSLRFSNFHILWLMSGMLRSHYEIERPQYFGNDLSERLVATIDEWFGERYRIADLACRQAARRAHNITREDAEFDVREFFRGNRNYGGQTATGLIFEACKDELEIAMERNLDLVDQLPH
ncbi:MAG: AIPR family protein [Chloroflexota bacterium]|nr:AIPR family protein [Chloroflexota bacterium]